jgi:hypothetical protein
MDTTRRYARSMREAFPRDATYGCALEVYRAPLIDRIGGVLLACLIGFGLAVSLVAWWS